MDSVALRTELLRIARLRIHEIPEALIELAYGLGNPPAVPAAAALPSPAPADADLQALALKLLRQRDAWCRLAVVRGQLLAGRASSEERARRQVETTSRALRALGQNPDTGRALARRPVRRERSARA